MSRNTKVSGRSAHHSETVIDRIVEATKCTVEQAEIALYDSNNDVQEAVNKILESSNLDTWVQQRSKKDKKKAEEEKKLQIRNGQFKRGPRPQNGNSDAPKPTKFSREIAKGVENKPFAQRKPRLQGDRSFKSKKDDNDDSWKVGPRVFERTDAEPASQPVPEVVQQPPPSQPACAAGPMSFAAVAARGNKKETPKVVEQQKPIDVEEYRTPSPAAEPEPVQSPAKSITAESLKSPAKPQKPFSPNPPTPVSQDSVKESLTDQLKNDLGLGSSHGSKDAVTPKYECASEVPQADVVFDFAGNDLARENSNVDIQRQPEPVAKTQEPAVPASLGDCAAHRVAQNIINQYNHSPAQTRQPQQSNASRVSNLSFSETSTMNYPQTQDVRANGAQPSPVKPQTTQSQSGSSLTQSNIPASQTSQSNQSHQQQQQQYMPPVPQIPYPNFGYMGMYNPYQYTPLGQMDFNPLGLMPALTVTSAGPMPAVQSHHQQNQQQPGHQRSDYYSDVKYPLNTNSQNNGNGSQAQNTSLNQSQQRQPMLDNNSQSMNANSQLGPPPGFAPAVNNLSGSQFVPQQNPLNNMFTQFQVPFPQMQYSYMINHQKMPPPPVFQQQSVDDQDSRLNQQQKAYNQPEKYGQSNGNKDRPVGQPTQSQLSSYVPGSYNGANQLLGNKKSNYHAWNS
ncbi:unnamed protein product [Bursaphelenchus okinawaensis]|uniref:UBA domain-containing protein n=1 Tax=Bursaphelenchus okinawaensis TaxID=465554 RepID=A0A811JSV8_9BILA|nr:unnamed protein product [Bursaphelenchus okinawaensis]CAG9081336.1 unnamed protein product [Bursaphelenchus okinawaensis]